MKRTAVIILSIILILLSSLLASASGENIIFLKAGNIDTDILPGQDESDQNVVTTSSTSVLMDDSEEYYIVQFEGHVTQQWKDEVEDTGAEFFDYIPNNAFVLRMNGTEKYLVESLDFVHWTGDFLPEYKLEPGLEDTENQASLTSTGKTDDMIDLIVVLFGSEDIARITEEIDSINGNVISNSDTVLRVEISQSRINELAAINGICWIERYSDPVLFNDMAAGIMKVNTVHNDLGLNGSDQIVAVCDTGLDTGVDDDSMHADIKGRIIEIIDYSEDGAEDYAGHGTHVAGSILGNGTLSSGQYKGIAPEANLVFQAVQKNTDSTKNMSAIPPLSLLFQDAYNLGTKIHSNSWGDPGQIGEYTSYSQQVDLFMWNHPDMLIIFAAGNEGADADKDGVIDENSITSPATAKNCITVGASENERSNIPYVWGSSYGTPISVDSKTDDISGLAAFSSRGPTDDNRIKPDLVAPGTFVASTRSSLASMWDYGITNTNYAYLSGTSMATPLVAGSAALVREYYAEIEQLDSPSAALLKATLINGAYDLTPGQYGTGDYQEISGRPDYSQGWGRVDVENSILVTYPEVIAYFDDVSLSDSKSWSQEYGYIKSDLPARATLVWTDYPSSLASSKALYNDLDLVISGPSDTYYGNGETDHINNVEGIELETVAEGDYTIIVDGYDIQEGPQPFALVFSFTCDNNEFPANGSYADSSTTTVSTDVVHPGGVNRSSIQMDIDGSPVVFTAESINDGYRIQYDTTDAYQTGVHNVSITALTNSGQHFSYEWKFRVRPEITSFVLTDPAVNGIIDNSAKTVTLTVPYGTDRTALTPSIVHNGISIEPGNGVEQNFISPVTYTVTAEDETTLDYTVTVNIEPNTAKEITSFEFAYLAVEGGINETTNTINLTVPYGTDVTILTPTIIHTGDSIEPASGVTQNFTNPVKYTVTAEDTGTQEYTVTVNIAPNTAKEITSFKFTDLAVEGMIDEATKTITLTVPYGTDVTALQPTIVHDGISIEPASGVTQDFINPMIYTVTAEDTTTQEYAVTVNIAPNTAKEITSFEFNDLAVVGVINVTTKTVNLTVPYGTNLTELVPTIIHTGISISPDSGVAQNFTNPVVYTITAEDTTTQEYTVIVDVAPNTAKEITSFEFADPAAEGVINETAKTINLTVPYGTNVTALIPTIVHTGQSISPETEVAQNFTKPVVYTVTAEDGTTQEYIVTVEVAASSGTTTTSTSTSSGGGGGGGGGGGTTGEEYENIEVKDVSSVFVGKGNVRFEFQRYGNDIQYVSYESLKNSGTISVTIEVLRDKSTFVDSLPSGEVYRNINIWVGKVGYATENNIDDPVIGFRVSRSWIENNNIDEDSIVLNRYNGGWSKLSTTQTDSDDDYLYFEASTPGFSPFAITGEANEKLLSVVDEQYSTEGETESSINASTVAEAQEETTISALSALISGLIISFVCFLIRKR